MYSRYELLIKTHKQTNQSRDLIMRISRSNIS